MLKCSFEFIYQMSQLSWKQGFADSVVIWLPLHEQQDLIDQFQTSQSPINKTPHHMQVTSEAHSVLALINTVPPIKGKPSQTHSR